MRVLKTMNTVGEIKREDIFGSDMDMIQQHQRSTLIMQKVHKIDLVVCLKHLVVNHE
jgi:hypothetical protein